MGHSPCHAGSVAMVLNPATGLISSQYHVVYDNAFTTVPYMRSELAPKHWKDLVEHACESILEEKVPD